MKDMRILEILKGRLTPEVKDLPLLQKVVRERLKIYGPTEQEAIKSYVAALEKRNVEKLIEAFAAIEKHDLKIATMICTVCGTILSEDKKQPLCEHFKEMFKDL